MFSNIFNAISLFLFPKQKYNNELLTDEDVFALTHDLENISDDFKVVGVNDGKF